MLRTSSYMISVKLDSEDGMNMLVHGYTGAIDIVSDSLVEKINNVASGYSFDDDILLALKKRGYITDRTAEEEAAYVERLAKALFKRSKMSYAYFTVVVTYNCNFRCPYCYEHRDYKDGNRKITFTREMVDKAYKVMEEIQPKNQLRNKVVTLYGGEPLLSENKDIVSYIVCEGVKRGYRFSAVTNGYELESFADLLSKDKIASVQITMDGSKRTHDQRRMHYTGDGTFEKVMSNVGLALDKGIGVAVRMNTDGRNAGEIAELKRCLEDRGCFSYKSFRFYSAPVKDNENISDADHRALDIISGKSYVQQHEQYHTEDFCQDFGITKTLFDAIRDRKPVKFGATFCAAQVNGYVLDPLGCIYPCWETVNKREHLLGIYSGKDVKWNDDVVSLWRSSNINGDAPCLRCRYALLCKGGCPFHRFGKIANAENCQFFHSVFNLAANQAYKKAKISSLIV